MEEITLRSLIDTVKSCSDAGKRYCFILGAGASSGIRTGKEMAEEWLKELEKNEPELTQEWVEKENIDKDDIGSSYSKIYERRFRADPAGGFIRLQKEMENKPPSPGYYYLAKIIGNTQNNLVITTNFDSLIEDALYIYENKKALVITHESLAKYINALANRPTVIKLHRDLLLQPKSGEDDVNTLPEEWTNSLKKIMDIYVPIVIGYGGNDGSLMGFLESVASRDRIIYWCYRRANPVNNKIKELLDKYKGFTIPIDNFDDTMHLFGTAFGYNFSDKTIRDVTNERAEKLIKEYKKWRKGRQKAFDSKGETLSDTERMAKDSFKSLSERNIAELEKKIATEQQNAGDYYRLGDEFYFRQEYKKAIEQYTKAIDLRPDNARYYNDRSVSYHNLNEYEKAVEDASKAIELEPENAEYHNNRSTSYHDLNEYEKAVEDASKAIELEPENAEYYNSRGVSYHQLNEYEKAIADYTRAIELDPDNARYYLDLARSVVRVNDFVRAFTNLNMAITIDNNPPYYFNVCGYVELKKAKHDKAECKPDVLDDLNKAIELNKDDSYTCLLYTDRAEYYLYSNQPDKAYDDLQKVLAANNKYGRAHFFMARYYQLKGNEEEYERCMAKSKECRFIPDESDY